MKFPRPRGMSPDLRRAAVRMTNFRRWAESHPKAEYEFYRLSGRLLLLPSEETQQAIDRDLGPRDRENDLNTPPEIVEAVSRGKLETIPRPVAGGNVLLMCERSWLFRPGGEDLLVRFSGRGSA